MPNHLYLTLLRWDQWNSLECLTQGYLDYLEPRKCSTSPVVMGEKRKKSNSKPLLPKPMSEKIKLRFSYQLRLKATVFKKKKKKKKKKKLLRNGRRSSLAVQWLDLALSPPGSIPDLGTEIPHQATARLGQKQTNKKQESHLNFRGLLRSVSFTTLRFIKQCQFGGPALQ